jgi:hypothetical protein
MWSLTSKQTLCAGLVLCGAASLAYGGNATSAMRLLENAFATMAGLEPLRDGPLHAYARGMSVIRHNPSPTVQFVEPLDGGEFQGYVAVEINNWLVDPSKATNAATQFANGTQEPHVGHTHVWIFDQETGARVRFTGANGLLLNPDTGLHESADFTLPPGVYKAYVQLQNHDHTAAIPATAPSFPGIDAVVFTVPESE